MKKTSFPKAVLIAAWLVPLNALMAQDNLWVNGSQLLDFNAPTGQIPVTGLPTGGDYTGTAAQYSQNAQYDENGDLLFFEVDGNLYDKEGYLMADNDANPSTCVNCLMKGLLETSIVGVPGTCDMYYIISGNQVGQQTALGYSVLDLSQPNPFHPGKLGAVVQFYDLPQAMQDYLVLTSEAFPAHNGITYENTNEPYSFWLASGNYNLAGDGSARGTNIHHTIFDTPNGPKTLFVNPPFGEYLSGAITDHGIEELSLDYSFNDQSPANNVLIMSGGIEVAQGPDNAIRMASTVSDGYSYEPGAGVTTLDLWGIQYVNGAPVQTHITGINTNVDDDNTTLGQIRGIAFSHNGRYLYFTQACTPNIGYVDVLDPTFTVHDLGSELGLDLSAYGSGQIDCNKSPDGNGYSVYFPYSAGMGYLDDADDPTSITSTNWHPNVQVSNALATPPISGLALAGPPVSSYPFTQYLMDKQNWNDQQIANLNSSACCVYRESSPEGDHANTFLGSNTYATPWTPNANGLGITGADHIYFSQDYTVMSGSRLYVRDMDWRFAENAKLII